MTGFKSKRAMGDSRFAVMYEDPDYEFDDDFDWETDEADWEDSVAEKQQEDFSPFVTMNS